MNVLQKLAKKKLVYYLVAVVALGAMLLFFGRDGPVAVEPPPYIPTVSQVQSTNPFRQEEELEARLAEFFSLVEGAGQVRVMISPLTGRETVFATDTNISTSTSQEQDAQGGTRETYQHQSQEQTVMITDRQGTDIPLILREIMPQASGIVIIAQGGDNPHVRDALTRAARAMLGIDAHNIQVLTMKGE